MCRLQLKQCHLSPPHLSAPLSLSGLHFQIALPLMASDVHISADQKPSRFKSKRKQKALIDSNSLTKALVPALLVWWDHMPMVTLMTVVRGQTGLVSSVMYFSFRARSWALAGVPGLGGRVKGGSWVEIFSQRKSDKWFLEDGWIVSGRRVNTHTHKIDVHQTTFLPTFE